MFPHRRLGERCGSSKAAHVTGADHHRKIACVQNQYNLVQREDDALVDSLERQNIAYVPFFPLGGSHSIVPGGLLVTS
jgi:pyridoxine 4-dehydrogenase